MQELPLPLAASYVGASSFGVENQPAEETHSRRSCLQRSEGLTRAARPVGESWGRDYLLFHGALDYALLLAEPPTAS